MGFTETSGFDRCLRRVEDGLAMRSWPAVMTGTAGQAPQP